MLGCDLFHDDLALVLGKVFDVFETVKDVVCCLICVVHCVVRCVVRCEHVLCNVVFSLQPVLFDGWIKKIVSEFALAHGSCAKIQHFRHTGKPV